MDLDVDVLVIGGGPAGSMAARYAAQAGAHSLMIEKRQEIGTPVRCGEGIAKHWLTETSLPASPEFIAHEIGASRVVAPDGSAIVVPDEGGAKGGYVIHRDLFDRYLARQAAKAGADVLIKTTATGLLFEDGQVTGARCEHMGSTFDVHAQVVIGADGFESQVGRWAGLTPPLRTRDLVSCLEYVMAGIEGESRYADFLLGSFAPGGYAWVFWKGDDVANVGLGIPLSKLHDRAEVKAYLDRFIARRPGFAKGEVVMEIAGGVTSSMPVERSVASGIMLVGDAAHLIDPLSGAGILNGLLSGMYAGEVAGRAVQEGDVSEKALWAYEQRWRARLEEELARHYLVKEGLQRIDDESINRIIRAVADANPQPLTTKTILQAVKARCPETLRAFEGLLA